MFKVFSHWGKRERHGIIKALVPKETTNSWANGTECLPHGDDRGDRDKKLGGGGEIHGEKEIRQ